MKTLIRDCASAVHVNVNGNVDGNDGRRARPLFVALAFALAGCTGASVPPTVPADLAATVNGRVITRAEVERLSRSGHGTGGSVDEHAVLEALISQELAAQRAEQLDLEPDEAGMKELVRAQAELDAVRRRVLSSALYAKEELKAADVSPADARAYFAAHQQDLRLQAHLKMVMGRSSAELEQLKAQGSLDSSARDLGYLTWAQMPAPWRAAVRALKPGELSAVLPGDHGRYWLLQRVDAHQGPELSLEAAMPMIRQAVAVERGSSARDALDAQLRQRARIVYPKARPGPVASASED
jgi:parvulin-like peptidyl-prolyl isomerase